MIDILYNLHFKRAPVLTVLSLIKKLKSEFFMIIPIYAELWIDIYPQARLRTAKVWIIISP